MSQAAGGSGIVIRRLTVADAGALLALRREALITEPQAFSASAEDDLLQSEEDARALLARDDGSAVFGAFGPELVGIAGLYREAKRKTRHKAVVWTVFVTPSARGRGAGRGLMCEVVSHANGLTGVADIHLGVREGARHALSLYESLGFVTWGIEPRSLKTSDEFISLRHMILSVR